MYFHALIKENAEEKKNSCTVPWLLKYKDSIIIYSMKKME